MTLLTENGEKHGLINTIANSVSDHEYKHMSPENKAKIEKKRKADSKKVRARYINFINDNERLEKPYCKYAGDPIEIYRLIPNYVYELPFGFVEEINEHQGLAQRGEKESKNGYINKDQKPKKIHELVAVGFNG